MPKTPIIPDSLHQKTDKTYKLILIIFKQGQKQPDSLYSHQSPKKYLNNLNSFLLIP